MAVYLNRERFRSVRRDERGRVNYRKQYKFGDEVDTDNLSEDHVERMLASGSLVESKDDLTGWKGYDRSHGRPALTGAATSEPADHSEIEPGEEPEDSEDPDGDEHDVDAYDGMDYAQLQQEAKKRDLNAGGSAQDLRERLREDDAE